METNRFVTKKNTFNRELLGNYEGISRSVMFGDSPELPGVMSITASIDKYPCSKKDWSDDVQVILRTLAVSNSGKWDANNEVVNTSLWLSLESLNNLVNALTEVRNELVELDNDVCEAFDIIGDDEDDD